MTEKDYLDAGRRSPSATTPEGALQPQTERPGSWDRVVSPCGEAVEGPTGHKVFPRVNSWGNEEETSGGVEGAAESGRNEGIERPEKGHVLGGIVPSSSSHQPPAPSLISRMAPLIRPFLACALFLSALVHAGVLPHNSDYSDPRLRPSSNPVVTVKNGSYGGVHSPEHDQDFFLGMRYAQVCHLYLNRAVTGKLVIADQLLLSYHHSQRDALPWLGP